MVGVWTMEWDLALVIHIDSDRIGITGAGSAF